ncbi:MAG: hypothetical protein HN705_11845 [Rhodospirillales bacterium]|mgnify:FL=1|nr:hypothetical protein [Rhodospirillales bacterium]
MLATQDRRQTESRRVSVSADIKEDQRSDGRRSDSDRRGNYINIDHDSEIFLFEMCEWLNASTKDAWQIGPNESEPSGSPVSCRVRFDNETDLTAFIAWMDGWRES